MPHLEPGGIQFIGTMQNLSAYKMRGSDQIILRRKGGPSRTKAKKSKAFVNPRRNSAEFGGRSTTTKWMTPIFGPLKHIADYSLSGALNGLLKPAQLLDMVSVWGQRNVLLSLNPHLLEGFNLNQKYQLETFIRPGLSYTLSRNTMDARVQIPALVPGDNFFMPASYDWYRITVVLGIVPDHLYTPRKYKPVHEFDNVHSVYGDTDWFAAKEGSTAVELQLSLPPTTQSSFSLMLLAGISFGKVAGINHIKAVKYVGAGKIIGMG